MNVTVAVDPHPLFDGQTFITEFPEPLGQVKVDITFAANPDLTDNVRAAVRDLLRHGGFKPTGRSKPASEYLQNAVPEGRLSSINLAVDACNAASLHSGLPISVVDLARAIEPFRVGIAAPGTRYVFNASGQTIDVGGLICLFDGQGPCANAVKDSQRTKTSAETKKTLSIVWGTSALPGRTAACVRFYRELLERHGARTFS